jgi:hypothetical protein
MSFYGYLVSTQRWRELVSASPASADMRARVLARGEQVIAGKPTIDCFELGLALGRMHRELIDTDAVQLEQFMLALKDTRDLNRLPYVSINGKPVS